MVQWVNWFPEWQKVGLHHWAKSHGKFDRTYPFWFDWSMFLGFWEIRHWHPYYSKLLKKVGGE